VHDLSITLLSRESTDISSTTTAKGKSTKNRAAGLEILTGAHLRIKSGGRYGFVGRNGSGKSSLLLLRAFE
jgi:ATPase subunit of ABC transporter with duplicated ATPase domains